MPAAAARTSERRFAQAVAASMVAHALAFYTLGGVRPHRLEPPLTLEVSLREAPPVVERPAEPPPRARAPEPAQRPARQSEAASRRAIPLRAEAPPSPAVPAVAPAETPPAADEPAAPALAAMPPVSAEPPAATPVPGDHDALRASFGRGIEHAIDAAKSYPRLARERGWQGTVRVRLRFQPGGSLLQIEVVDSSGFPLLDEHALRMARTAELPRVPGALAAQPLELDVPIRFRLRS